MRRKVKGQAAVMGILFLGVSIVVLLFLYKAGRLTADRMELQNAADSAAYSVSVIEARDLNFASYMNRAIVANEVAVGQAVGLASWAYHWESIGLFLLEYNKFLTGPTLGASNSVLPPMAKVFTVPAKSVFKPLMKGYANAITTVNHYANQGYGTAQQIYHYASVINALGQLKQSLDDNAPSGTRLSDFGLLSVIAHLGTYGNVPGLPGEQFTQSYKPTEKAKFEDLQKDTAGDTDAGGYGRLSAVINNSGDKFVRERGWDFNLFAQLNNAGLIPNFDLGGLGFGVSVGVDAEGFLGIRLSQGFDLGFAGYDLSLFVALRIIMAREGGSQLRLVIPISGGDKGKAAGDMFNWSSADGTVIDIGFKGEGSAEAFACVPIIGPCIRIGAKVPVRIADERLEIRVVIDLPLGLGTINEQIASTAFPTSAPFGAAFAQVVSGSSNTLTSKGDYMGKAEGATLAPSGPIANEAYGGVPKRTLAWEYPPSPTSSGLVQGIFHQAGVADRKVSKAYGGLPKYIDTTNKVALQGSGGPFILIGLERLEESFDRANWSNEAQEPKGTFALEDHLGHGRIATIAKAEVAFRRPLDLSYFARGDGYQELGNAFNPYWQARLAETSHADRIAALDLQQRQSFDAAASGQFPPDTLSQINQFWQTINGTPLVSGGGT